MGFTVYWTRIPTDGATFRRFVDDLKKMIRYSQLEEKDGFVLLRDNEDCSESFYTDATGTKSTGFCKTGRSDFTYDVMAACILMDHYKMVSDYGNDDEEEYPWRAAFERVQHILGWSRIREYETDAIEALKARILHLEEQLSDARLFAEKILSVLRNS